MLSEPFDPTLEVDYCPDCMRIAGPIAERRQRHERLRAEGKPIGLAELLDQGVWWRSSDGEWLTISFMERSHAHNAAEWLRRRSLPLAFRYELARMPDPFADDGILHAIAMEDERRMGDPQGWLESTACYRALANRGAGR
ncbi:MAG: hypothetical protein KDB37_21765 [Ilumatobacter sp.]|nr:hypothetical protein [Ilumatobacter sp.]